MGYGYDARFVFR